MAVSEELLERLKYDTPFWAAHCARIVDKRAELVPLVANSAQLKFDRAMEAQRAAGLPIRVIVLKARKLGFSTWAQAKIMQRITQRPNRRALVVAQDTDTATALFNIGERIYAHLPTEPELHLKPRVAGRNRGRFMLFGEPARTQREQGLFGLDSSLAVDTANEVEAGRGYTYNDLHGSEIAFWPNVDKLTALLNAVPDEPETMIVLESTANGSNHFKTSWERAVAGESSYVPVFAGWWEDPGNQMRFYTDEDRQEFIAGIGEGPWGEAEPRLVEQFGCTPEQLKWRRQTIVDKTRSDLSVFQQEHPASAEESFMASGKHVFSMTLISRVLDNTKQTDPDDLSPDNPGPELGILEPARLVAMKTRSGMVDVPVDPVWKPRAETGLPFNAPLWRVWDMPDPGGDAEEAGGKPRPRGKYVVAVDPASGEEQTESGESAFHAIQVIDHRTRIQVAEYRSRVDPDLVAVEAYKAALFFNKAILGIEKTGGYGLLMLNKVFKDFRYPLVYRQKSLDRAKLTSFEDRLGWDTNRASKTLIEDGIRELLRETPYVIRSRQLAQELTTYVRDPKKAKTGPEPNAFADLLMSFGIAQQIAQEWVVPRDRDRSTVSTTRRARDSVTGY